MKKFICIFLSMILFASFIGCSKTENPQRYQYDVFQDIDWGTSFDKTVKKLDLDAKQQRRLLRADIRTDGEYGFFLKTNVYGAKAEIECVFVNDYGRYKNEFGLSYVVVNFDKQADTTNVLTLLQKQLDENNIHRTTKTITDEKTKMFTSIIYSSDATFAKLQDNYINDRLKNAMGLLYPNEEDRKNAYNKPLSQVTVKYLPESEKIKSIRFDGFHAAVLLAETDKNR